MKVADEVSRAVMIRNVNAHDLKCQSVNSQIIDLLDQENKEKR